MWDTSRLRPRPRPTFPLRCSSNNRYWVPSRVEVNKHCTPELSIATASAATTRRQFAGDSYMHICMLGLRCAVLQLQDLHSSFSFISPVLFLKSPQHNIALKGTLRLKGFTFSEMSAFSHSGQEMRSASFQYFSPNRSVPFALSSSSSSL